MKVTLTGWDGFLSRKLRENKNIQWQKEFHNSDFILLMGSPTFTGLNISKEEAKVLHNYVKETIDIIDKNLEKPIIFCSTTGVDDIDLDHQGSTAYNLSKLYLENYIINNVERWSILRIGTIISKDINDVMMMKSDRIQNRILKKEIQGIPFEDKYLHIETFVNSTIDLLKDFKVGIHYYNLVKYTLPKLSLLLQK